MPLYIEATTILDEVVNEIGGTKPIYNDVSMCAAAVDCEVSFKIPRSALTPDISDGADSDKEEGQDNDESYMVEIRESAESDALALNKEIKPASHYKLTSYRGALTYTIELAAHEALQLLRDDHDIATIDYNFYEAEHIRENSGELVHRIKQSRNMYAYASSQCQYMLNDLKLATDQCPNNSRYTIKIQHIHRDSMNTLEQCNNRAYQFKWKIHTVLKRSYVHILKKRNQVNNKYISKLL